ncbi:MAG: T3SS effector HopA1 family protein [Patescibacteria group bacterium]
MNKNERMQLLSRARTVQQKEQERTTKKESKDPTFLETDGIYEIPDEEIEKYFTPAKKPEVYKFQKTFSRDFLEYLNDEFRTFDSRKLQIPAYGAATMNRFLMIVGNLRGDYHKRLVRNEGAYWLFERWQGMRLKEFCLELLDTAGRPSSRVTATRLERREQQFDLSTVNHPVLKEFFAHYPPSITNTTSMDAEQIRNDFFIVDRTREVTEDDCEKVQQLALKTEEALREYRVALGEDVTDGLFDIHKSGERKSWLHVQLNGGAVHDEQFGKIFINISPERFHALFEKLSKDLLEASLAHDFPLDLKTLVRCTKKELERIEKIVVYFNDPHISHIIKVLEELVEEFPELLENNASLPFALPLKINGKPTTAMTFAQQPVGDGSWAESRSSILAQIFSLVEHGEDPVRALDIACERSNVSKDHPAFEAGGESHFPETQKYLEIS